MTSMFAGNNVFGQDNKPNQIISLWPEQPKIKLEVFFAAIFTERRYRYC
jgi:hypothetical protein